jgi:small subunit ribosomal protein S7
MSEIKAFNKWGTEGISVADPGLRDYINLDARIVPKTGARYAGKRFYKSRVFIVERLINKIMIPGHKGKKHNKSSGQCTGKASTAYNLMLETLEMIEKRTNENPIKVLVKAIENAAPREEIVTIEYGGARYPKAVECAPQRRVDLALRYFVQGAYQKSFGTKRKAAETLAEEIVFASQSSGNSNAISKKNEIERQADASR